MASVIAQTSHAAEFAPAARAERVRLSLALVAMLAAVLLIYASGSFLATEILGIKRFVQMLLAIPVAAAAIYYLLFRSVRGLDPLVCFVVLKTVTEVVMRGQWLYILDSVITLLALIVVCSVPDHVFRTGAKFVVFVAGTLALMALVQWLLLFSFPELGSYRLIVRDDGTFAGEVRHPIALLGLFSEAQYSLLGHPVPRLQSFAKEPSLNVVYFMLPASLAFLLRSTRTAWAGMAILAFCVLSLSGSVFLSLGFTALGWCVLRVASIEFVFAYGLVLFMGFYLFVLQYFGLEPLVQGVALAAQYGDFLNKGASLTDRSGGALSNLGAALGAPLGGTLPDIPGPWLLGAALAAGWLGVLMLLWFLRRFGRAVRGFDERAGKSFPAKIGIALMLGVLATVIVFNDYQMSNFAGIVLLAIIYRTICLEWAAQPAR